MTSSNNPSSLIIFKDWQAADADEDSPGKTSGEYDLKRLQAERAAAHMAKSPVARVVHRQLAQAYAARARQSRR